VRRTIAIVIAALLSLAIAPVGAEEIAEEGCDPAVGRELLTPDGFAVTVDSPLGYHDVNVVREASEDRSVPLRNADLHLQADFGDAERARVTMTLEWDEAVNDYDLLVLNDRGFIIGQSEEVNPETGDAREELSINVRDCQQLTVWLRNFAGAPGQPLDLTIEVEPDTDPGEVAADTRTILYAGGDPGQVSMVHSFDANTDEIPVRSTLDADRPTGFTPNQYTRAVVGSITERNPFQPHFTTGIERRDLVGPASAVVYLSTPLHEAQLDGGEILVRLLLDGMIHAEQTIPMTELTDVPQPFFVDFGEISRNVRMNVGIDVVAEPAVSPNNPEVIGDLSDAAYSLWYDSAQFPTRVIVP
jgi:hypothetical protein